MSNVYLFFWLMLLGARQPITAIAPHSKRCAPQKLPSPAARPGQWVPDIGTRNLANKINENRVGKMSLGGYFKGIDEFNPNLAIKEQKLIHLFLAALRNAQRWSENPELAGNRSSYIIFHYKDRKQNEENPEFTLNFVGFNEHYGPPFEHALLKLAEFRADELRTFVKHHAEEVSSLGIKKGEIISLPSELSVLLKELAEIKTSDCFVYFNRSTERKLTFTLENGKETSFYLSLREPPKEKPEKPDPFFETAFYALAKPDPVEKPVAK